MKSKPEQVEELRKQDDSKKKDPFISCFLPIPFVAHSCLRRSFNQSGVKGTLTFKKKLRTERAEKKAQGCVIQCKGGSKKDQRGDIHAMALGEHLKKRGMSLLGYCLTCTTHVPSVPHLVTSLPVLVILE